MKALVRLFPLVALLVGGCATDSAFDLRRKPQTDSPRNTFEDLKPLDESSPFGRRTTSEPSSR